MAKSIKYRDIDIQTLEDGQIAISYEFEIGFRRAFEVEEFNLSDFSSFVCSRYNCDCWRMPDNKITAQGVMTEATDWQKGEKVELLKINNSQVRCYIIGQITLSKFLNEFSFG